MINDASVVIGGGNWGIKEADVLGYKLINDEYYARDIDFANSTAAGTYTDSTGVIRKAPYNLLQYSEQFDNIAWLKGTAGVGIAPSVTANTSTSPIGTLTADRVQFNCNGTAGADRSILYQPVAVITGAAYTFSVYIKANSPSEVGKQLRFLIEGGGVSAQVITITADWTLYTFVAISTTGSAINCMIETRGGVTANTTADVLIWGAQLVEGTASLPYFPTTTRLNVPRIDYRNADGSLSTTGRLLIEPQRTNLALYSEQFDNAYWQKDVGASVTANAATSPDGSANADRLSFISSGVAVYRSGFGLSGAHRFTIYLKGEGANIGKEVYLEIAGGTSINVTLTGSWQRFTAIADNALSVAIKRLNLGQADSVLAWGLQLEAGAYPTSYIPTTTATVTRNADSASKTGVSSWIGQTEGTLFVEIDIDHISTGIILAIGDGTANNRFVIQFTNATTLYCTVRVAGVNADYVVTIPAIPANGGVFKVALGYKTNDYVFALNGVIYSPSTASRAVPACSVLFVGMSTFSANQLEGGVKQTLLFPTRLTNEQLSQITTL